MVIGATGNVGRHVVDRLHDLRAPAVRALVRAEERVSAVLPAGVDIVEGNLTDFESLEAALIGVDTVLLMWPFLNTDGAPAVLEAVGRHAQRIVYLSSVGVGTREERDDPIFAMHAAMEQLIDRSSLARTILRSDTIASNTLGWAEQIRATGVVRGPLTAPTAVVDPRDLAAVAAAALTDAAHAGQTYLLTGPRVISRPEQVDAIGAAIGRSLRFEEVAVEAARLQMLADGRPQALVDALLAAAEKRSTSTLVTSTIQEITGRPARSFEQWAIDHAEAFPLRRLLRLRTSQI
ncbi:NAD(P)H-binding protein [Nocardia veterana]|uniref:NAD(P)H-binding protein n=1 Tax=Nocardia veterana TaxID=132249 RepID=A0A7X6LYW6_9NOCA|nr:NAD(P)H-binding protein [Nocardia veterana]